MKPWIVTWKKFVEQRAPRTTNISNVGGGGVADNQPEPGTVTFSVRRQGWATLAFENVQVSAGGNIRQINFTAFSIDEADIGFFGIGTTDETTNPLTLTPTLYGSSRYRQFVSNIKVTSDPGGHLSAPAVTVEGTALAHSVIDGYGNITAIVVDDPGFYYPPDWPSPPTVTVAGGATAVATLSNWKVGDFICWNDPVAGYEINEITAMTFADAYPYGVTGWTLRRQSDGAISGDALFGSLMSARTDKPFWRVFPRVFSVAMRPDAFGGECDSGLPRTYTFVWPNNCIVAVSAQAFGDGGGGPVTTQNLAPDLAESDPAKLPLCPGLRLLKGGGYSDIGFLGSVAAGDTALARAKLLDGPHSIRNLTADVRTAPTGQDLILWVVYITPDKADAGVLDKLTISAGSTQSYADDPRDRQMPYHSGWTKPLLDGSVIECPDWPPTLIPSITDPFDASGNLKSGVTPNAAVYLQVTEDGYVDFVLDQVGSSEPGEDVTIDYRN